MDFVLITMMDINYKDMSQLNKYMSPWVTGKLYYSKKYVVILLIYEPYYWNTTFLPCERAETITKTELTPQETKQLLCLDTGQIILYRMIWAGAGQWLYNMCPCLGR